MAYESHRMRGEYETRFKQPSVIWGFRNNRAFFAPSGVAGSATDLGKLKDNWLEI